MPCAGDLTLPKLLKALKNVDNWFWFGTMLNVPHSELSKIESKHQRDPDRCKIDMLQYWLNNESEPTWSYVVRALEDANHRALAAQIRREFIEDRGECNTTIIFYCHILMGFYSEHSDRNRS